MATVGRCDRSRALPGCRMQDVSPLPWWAAGRRLCYRRGGCLIWPRTGISMRPRLIIGADGRASTVRKQSSIHINKAPATHVIAGLLVEGASRWPDDQCAIGVERDLQFYVFPQGGGRVRLYTCHANEQATRWAGRAGTQRFVEAFAGLRSIPESLGLGDVRPAGPCGTFGGEQTWCDEPYADGIVLLGDAGGYDDPVDGQGMSLALRDVRQLSELLLASDDWTPATLRRYGEQRAERLRRMRRVSKTFAALMTTFTAAGCARPLGAIDSMQSPALASRTFKWPWARSFVARTACPARRSQISSTNRCWLDDGKLDDSRTGMVLPEERCCLSPAPVLARGEPARWARFPHPG